jgi:serine/threonine protein kinase/Tfp pilus assembly protein PilF
MRLGSKVRETRAKATQEYPVANCDLFRRRTFEVNLTDSSGSPQSITPTDLSVTRRPNDALAPATGDTPLWIGRYQLLEKLGEGGMGAVWLAEQHEPVKRQVALKLIKAAIRDASTLQRFDLERQALAIMNHPAIARVFDAGTTPEGQPYFVMEYVPGVPISLYCEQKELTIRQRLELLMAVCEGVQHAHQKAIIHRDLKPSNILITEIDGKPVPRIIDFGIAKALSATPAATEAETLFTQPGGMVGTLGYMSPEQADPGALDVDTRTDVYSLGAVLYELLTGSLPWNPKVWKTKSLYEWLRQLREQDPERPSARLKTGAHSAKLEHSGEAQNFTSQLEGDLDWIAMKAIDKDRERRYNSPLEFASDLGRYLKHEPVIARPPSVLYRARKFVRRNRLAVGLVSTLATLIVGFAISMTIERNRANREAELSKNVTDFMTNVFNISNPNASSGSSVTARELLDKASAQIENPPGKDSQVQARMMAAMGRTYMGLGLFQQARVLTEHAAAIESRLLGPTSPETLQTQGQLGYIYDGQGKYADGEKLLRQTLASQQKILGPDNPQTLETGTTLAGSLTAQGKYAEAEGLIRRALASQQSRLGPGDQHTLRTMRDLAANLRAQGQLAEAERLGREILPLATPQLGPNHPITLSTMNILAMTLQQEGKYNDAEKLLRETLRRVTQVYGSESQNALATLSNLGLILEQEGRLNEAETMERDEMARTRAAMGPEHPDTLGSMDNLAVTLGKEKKFAEAEQLFRKELEIEMRTLGPSFPDTLATMENLAAILANEKRAEEAIALYEKAVNQAEQAERPIQMQAHYTYGGGLSILGRPDEAFQQLQLAAQLGFQDADQLATDEDFKPLRSDPRFFGLLASIRKQTVTPKV